MSNIPINPASIANAGQYTATGAAQTIKVLDKAKEGVKALSMQFVFNEFPGWLVNFPNNPNPAMSQIAALYIDATNSEFDVTVLFPDTGYSVRVNALGSRLVPVISSAGQNTLPKFYVLLDSSNTLTSDVINIIALNQFIPEFEAGELADVLSYGYGEFFIPQPDFTQSKIFYTPALFFGLANTTATLINASQWYITDMFINATINSGQAATLTLQLLDAGNIIFAKAFQVAIGENTIDIIEATALQVLSSGNGPLTAKLMNVNLTSGANFNFTIMGGRLIS